MRERRTNRSNHTDTALQLQLAATAKRGQFSSLAVVEELGFVVASAGPRSEAEEIAALTPIIAGDCELWHGKVRTASGETLVTIKALDFDSGPLYLSAVGGDHSSIIRELSQSGAGVCRILA